MTLVVTLIAVATVVDLILVGLVWGKVTTIARRIDTPYTITTANVAHFPDDDVIVMMAGLDHRPGQHPYMLIGKTRTTLTVRNLTTRERWAYWLRQASPWA